MFHNAPYRRSFLEVATRGVLLKNLFLKILQYSQEKNCVGATFNKVTGLQAYEFIRKILLDRCFLMKIGKFLRTPILKNICEELLLVKVFVFIAVMTQAIASI